MTKLYTCTAQCDENTLISYNTKLVNINRNEDRVEINIYRYPSATSAQHLRKYTNWLREHNEGLVADVYNLALNDMVANHKRFATATFDYHTGEISVEWED
jgi:hypothetical protein